MKSVFQPFSGKYSILLILLLQAFQSFSQETTIHISVRGANREPIPFASITLVSYPDKTFRKTQAADSSGQAWFTIVGSRKFTVSITAVNHKSLEKDISTGPGKTGFSFTLEPDGKTLQDVVVTAQKPVMRQEDDKTIVEPENLAAISTSGYEVIEKTPGLFVDQDGNIYISSLTPASVQINGRDMRMSAADVATMLKSLPPNAISRIEIVRTPSAKYDANSSGGIVNVVLRKGVKIGLTGSINTGMQQGKYGNQFAGFTLNNNDGKKTSSISLNYARRNSFERIKTDRIFAPDSMLSQDANTIYPGQTWFASYSLVFPAGKKWDIDFGTSGSLNTFENNSENRNVIRKISSGQVLSDNLNLVTNTGSAGYFRAGLEGVKKLDTLGSEWENDIFYSYSRNKSAQDFSAGYFVPVVFNTGGDGTGINNRHLLNLKEDIRLKWKKRFTLEAGAKASFQFFDNRAEYFRIQSGLRTKDAARTNTFRYRENINSAYLQGSKTIGKDFVIKTGLRLENTNMEGHQLVPADTSFSIHRTDLFPYVYLSRKLMKIAGYELRSYLVYRRTISRPGYNELNPFPRYVDQYLTEQGNPALKPQFTNNFEANVSVDERPILAIGVNDTRDIFTNVIYQSDSSRTQAYRTYDNLGSNREWYFRGLGALPPGGKYFLVIGGQYNHNFYQGLYENKPLSFRKGTWTFFTYQTLKLDKRSVITLQGFIRLKGQQQFYELSSFGALNSSINRKFIKDKLIVTLSMNDIFYTNKNDFLIKQGSVNATGTRYGDTRRFGINLRYNFGIRKKEENNDIFRNAEPPGG